MSEAQGTSALEQAMKELLDSTKVCIRVTVVSDVKLLPFDGMLGYRSCSYESSDVVLHFHGRIVRPRVLRRSQCMRKTRRLS